MPSMTVVSTIDFPYRVPQRAVRDLSKQVFASSFPDIARMLWFSRTPGSNSATCASRSAGISATILSRSRTGNISALRSTIRSGLRPRTHILVIIKAKIEKKCQKQIGESNIADDNFLCYYVPKRDWGCPIIGNLLSSTYIICKAPKKISPGTNFRSEAL